MQRQTAVDALIDAGRDVVTAVGAERGRSTTTGGTDSAGPIGVGALLVLAVAAAPILVVAIVGYVVTLARDPDPLVPRFDTWVTIGTAGARGTVLIAVTTLPLGAALGGSGMLDVEARSVVLGSTPGPVVGVVVAALAVVTWHAAAVGTAAVAAGPGRGIVEGIQFGRSAAGIRLSAALAGLVGGGTVVGFGLTAIPIIGPVLGAVGGGIGIVIAGRLMSRAVSQSNLDSEARWKAGGDRLAVPTDSTVGSRHGTLERERY
jgi:hypothetical protein